MQMLCPQRIDCDTAFLSNYSSEGAEPFPPFYAVVYPPITDIPLDQEWSMPGCLYICKSYISQEDANLCALRQAILCDNPPGEEIWYSAPASCTTACPDGSSSYTYLVPAGTFVANTYEKALAQAQAYACEQAQINRVCLNDGGGGGGGGGGNTTLGNLPRCACKGVLYSGTIQANGATTDQTWAVVGSLPPGLSFIGAGTGAVIAGTPTVSGTYAFQVVATDSNGNYAIRTFTIQVVEITTNALPDFIIGTPYSHQLTAAGGSGNYTWSVATGTLPDGLSISVTGLISGTPTALATGGTLTFEVRDATCEAAQRIALTPRVSLRTTSSSRVTTYRGFKEYGSGTDLGQLYKRVDYAGSLTQIAFPNFNADPAVNATQCGGFQYIYSGYDRIDNNGNILNRHRKDMMLMCSASQPKLYEVEIAFGTTATISPILSPPALYGYCWAADPESCPSCDTNDTTWSLFRDDAWFGATDYPTDMVWDADNLSTTSTVLTYAGNASLVGGVSLEPSIVGFPKNTGFSIYTEALPFVRLESSGGFSATLSEPYTDADANATAVIYAGTLATAENTPNYQVIGANNLITRRSRVTSVAFTLICTNLITGTDYTVTYEFVSSDGSGMSASVDFTATGTTHEINGTIPTPAANVKTTVKNPRIQYA